MEPATLSLLFACALISSFSVKLWLASRHMRHVAAHRDVVPRAFSSIITLGAHQKAADYTLVKGRFAIISLAASSIALLGWTLLGGLDTLNQWMLHVVHTQHGNLAYQLSLLLAFGVITGLLDLPLDLYSTFKIEQRFGFNRITIGLYLSDMLKNAMLSCVIGLPLASLMLWIMGAAGHTWWIWAWGTWMVFSLMAMWIYPVLISPLYNNFKPLEDDQLKERVRSLLHRCGFKAQGLFVMDGGKRSAHSNAYFTGMGSAKRVVFFDTLLSLLNADELEAVLAHELGHFKHKHILKRIGATFVISFIGFGLIGWLSSKAGFFVSLGVQPSLAAPNDALALLLFLLCLPVFDLLVAPLLAHFSRRHEFQADAYACKQVDSRHLVEALLKLYKGNAATLTPEPLYARVYYSHPPASERITALQPPPAPT